MIRILQQFMICLGYPKILMLSYHALAKEMVIAKTGTLRAHIQIQN